VSATQKSGPPFWKFGERYVSDILFYGRLAKQIRPNPEQFRR
jgi:hypothetical protein